MNLKKTLFMVILGAGLGFGIVADHPIVAAIAAFVAGLAVMVSMIPAAVRGDPEFFGRLLARTTPAEIRRRLRGALELD